MEILFFPFHFFLTYILKKVTILESKMDTICWWSMLLENLHFWVDSSYGKKWKILSAIEKHWSMMAKLK